MGTAEHEQAHLALESQVVSFAEAFESRKAARSVELFMFLSNWPHGRIRGSDRRYAPCMKERGAAECAAAGPRPRVLTLRGGLG